MFPLFLLAACSEWVVEPGGSGKETGGWDPTGTTAVQVDEFTQTPAAAVDVLWVIDNSGSMSEEQTALRDNAPRFVSFFTDAGLDYHLGVVSTDMESRDGGGRLVEDSAGGTRYVDSGWDDGEALVSFQERVMLGIAGSSEERGKDAAHAAVSTERDTTNAGFYRDEAYLSIIVVSDEVDHSEMDVETFVAWMGELKSEPAMRSFSSIVGPDPTGCATAEPGIGYLEVTESIGGVSESICTADWSALLAELGLASAGLSREFALSAVPVEESLSVSVRSGEEATDYAAGTDWTYDAVENSVSFVELLPAPGDVVSVRYLLASSTAGTDTN